MRELGIDAMNALEIGMDDVDVGSASERCLLRRPKGPAPRRTTSTRSSVERQVLIQTKRLLLVGGLLAAAVALSGCKDAAAVAEVRPVDVDVAPVIVKRIRYWDEFNGRISAI